MRVSMIRNALAAFAGGVLLALAPISAHAQSSGLTWSPGTVLTATQMQNLDDDKVNVTSGTSTSQTLKTPTITGGTATALEVSAAIGKVLGASVSRYIDAKLLDVVSVRDFGAKGDGSTDDYAAINAAIAYSKTTSYGGGRIWFPDGVYNISAPIILTGSGFSLVGTSPKSVTIQATYTAGNIIQIGVSPDSLDNEDDGIYGLNLTGSSEMTSGSAIYVDGAKNLHINNVKTSGFIYNGIDVEGSIGTTYGVYISNAWISGVENRGLIVGSTASSSSTVATDVFLTESMVLPAQSAADCGICLYGVGGFYSSGVDITNVRSDHFNNAITFDPSSSSDVNAVMLSRVLADSSNNDNILFGGSGIIADVTITNGWASTSSSEGGIAFNNPKTDGVTIDATAIDSNAEYGVLINSGQNISIQSSRILNNSMSSTGNYDGITVAAGVSYFSITSNDIGNGGWFNQTGHSAIHQRYGVNVLSGSSDGYVVTNNRGMSNSSGILSDNGTGENKTTTGNISY